MAFGIPHIRIAYQIIQKLYSKQEIKASNLAKSAVYEVVKKINVSKILVFGYVA